MKRLILILFCLVLMITISSCSKSISGTYVNEANSGEYLELKSDRSFYSRESGIGVAGKYEVDGDVITLKLESGRAARVRIKGNILIDEDGKNWIRRKNI